MRAGIERAGRHDPQNRQQGQQRGEIGDQPPVDEFPRRLQRIEDNRHNATRFLVIGGRGGGPSGRDKTSILFAMRNEPGSLHRILEPFAQRGVNLTKIESRPAKRQPWDYVMFLDFEGHRDTPSVAAVLREVEARTLFLRVLGSYPAA